MIKNAKKFKKSYFSYSSILSNNIDILLYTKNVTKDVNVDKSKLNNPAPNIKYIII